MRPTAQTPAAVRAAITADVDAELSRVHAAEAEHREALAAVRREADEIRAEHKDATLAARLAMQPAPPLPPLPDGREIRDSMGVLTRTRTELGHRREQALAAGLPQVMAAWQSARPGLDERARAIAAAAEVLAREYADWWTLVREVRRADEHKDPNQVIRNGPSERMRPRPTPADVLTASAGVDLCGVLSASTSRTPVTGKAADGSSREVRLPASEPVGADDVDAGRFGHFLSKVTSSDHG